VSHELDILLYLIVFCVNECVIYVVDDNALNPSCIFHLWTYFMGSEGMKP